jgi:hypothetical protein
LRAAQSKSLQLLLLDRKAPISAGAKIASFHICSRRPHLPGDTAMSWKFWCLGVGLLPICFLSAQQPNSNSTQQTNPNQLVLHQPSPEFLRKAAEERKRMQEHSEAINDLAGNIQSLDDARRLVNLVADEFSHDLPPKWTTHGIRDRIARTEYASAAEGALIPEQHVADAWNDFLEKIGAPQESFVTGAEIHTLRDEAYTGSQVFWARGNQNIWTVPNVYAIGTNGKVADGCRALEAMNILWQLVNQPEVLQGARDMIKKNQRFSDSVQNPSKPPAAGTEKGYVTLQKTYTTFGSVTARVIPPNPIDVAARKYMQDHGLRAMNRAVEDLLNDLFGR